MKKYLAAALVVLWISCALKPSPKWPAAWAGEFLHVCWRDAPATSFAPAVDCDQPEIIEWGTDSPLVVTSDVVTRFAAIEAVEIWNAWLGLEMFVYEVTTIDPDVVVLYEGLGPPQGDAAALTLFEKRHKDGKQHAIVIVFDAGMSESTAFTHELGHVLGLAHDKDNPGSIMYPSLRGMISPGIEAQDFRALRHRYYPRKALK